MKHYLKDFAQPVAASAWLAMVGWADSKLCISGGTLARQSGRSFIDIWNILKEVINIPGLSFSIFEWGDYII